MIFAGAVEDEQLTIEPERRYSVTDAFVRFRRGGFDRAPTFLQSGALVRTQRGKIIFVCLEFAGSLSPLPGRGGFFSSMVCSFGD
jgi:hypothetical protein